MYDNRSLTEIDRYIKFIEKQNRELGDLFSYMSTETMNTLVDGFEQMAKTLRNMSEILKPVQEQYEAHRKEVSNNV